MNRSRGGRGGRGSFFHMGDPFAGFGGFGGFGGERSLLSGFFGGRDPFDDPFFTRPFGGMFESTLFGSSPFGPMGNPFGDMDQPAYLENQPSQPKRGLVIEEIDSDDEKGEGDKEKKDDRRTNKIPRKHARSDKAPYVEEPHDDTEERKGKHLQLRNDNNRFNHRELQPQTHSFTFQSSTVTYGGANGTYHTSSKTRKIGSDGVTIEESKEADSGTLQATHRISKGLHNKGHTVARKLNADGRVDTMQTLHNLGEDELAGFEKAWNGSAQRHLPGWTGGSGSSGQNAQASRGGWALPTTQPPLDSIPDPRDEPAYRRQHSGMMQGASNVRDNKAYSQWRPRN